MRFVFYNLESYLFCCTLIIQYFAPVSFILWRTLLKNIWIFFFINSKGKWAIILEVRTCVHSVTKNYKKDELLEIYCCSWSPTLTQKNYIFFLVMKLTSFRAFPPLCHRSFVATLKQVGFEAEIIMADFCNKWAIN